MARRIAVQYGDSEYVISGREIPDVMAEIEAGVAAADPTWLDVTVGQGRATHARLLLGAGIPIAVWEVNTTSDPSPTQAHPASNTASGAAAAPS